MKERLHNCIEAWSGLVRLPVTVPLWIALLGYLGVMYMLNDLRGWR